MHGARLLQSAHDLGVLIVAIKAHGKRNPASGKIEAPYGAVYEATQNTLEALNGTLRTAKRQKKVRIDPSSESPQSPTPTVTFEGELLMMPKDASVPLVLLDEGEDGVSRDAEAKVDATLP
ncbi:hypothetical protein DMC30DRAFT_416869 [Rhodotorula diobovata]|uniref:Costars domain-containing protein n=1 Tax=Rhodotorula diobovata TaxID=5288 RepID=A0A5C5FUU8_9BASI|nr:hypothetical protein DMC30DRAFT_416869 [Rhodotorula diobovata]